MSEIACRRRTTVRTQRPKNCRANPGGLNHRWPSSSQTGDCVLAVVENSLPWHFNLAWTRPTFSSIHDYSMAEFVPFTSYKYLKWFCSFLEKAAKIASTPRWGQTATGYPSCQNDNRYCLCISFVLYSAPLHGSLGSVQFLFHWYCLAKSLSTHQPTHI